MWNFIIKYIKYEDIYINQIGAEVGTCLFSLPILPRAILKNRMNSSFFQIILVQFILLFKIVLSKQLAQQGIE